MSVHNGHVRVVTGAWLRDFSTSGLPVVGGINIRHFNNARPFWNKCFIHLGMVWHMNKQVKAKTTFDDYIII
jgi:hypothetical protein